MEIMPIKTRILEYCILENRPVTAKDVADQLSTEIYAGEKTTNVEYIEKQILCYCRVGFLEPVGMRETGDAQELEYRATEAGKEEIVYIPGHGNKLI